MGWDGCVWNRNDDRDSNDFSDDLDDRNLIIKRGWGCDNTCANSGRE